MPAEAEFYFHRINRAYPDKKNRRTTKAYNLALAAWQNGGIDSFIDVEPRLSYYAKEHAMRRFAFLAFIMKTEYLGAIE